MCVCSCVSEVLFFFSKNGSRYTSFCLLLSKLAFWKASLVAQLVNNPPECRRPGLDPWVGKIPWRRERLSTPVFWSREFHGLYSPWGHKESDTTERLSLSDSTCLENYSLSIFLDLNHSFFMKKLIFLPPFQFLLCFNICNSEFIILVNLECTSQWH